MGEFNRPFRGSTALSRKLLTRHQLSAGYQRLHRDVYIEHGVALTPSLKAEAAAAWAGDDGVLAGLSAAAVLGTRWIDANHPAAVYRSRSRRHAPGIQVRVADLPPQEVIVRDGIRLTSPARTGFDLGRWFADRQLDLAVEVLDALCQSTGLTPAEILAVAERHPTAHGLRRLRRALALVDGGAQSPPETRTRLLLIRAGLPRPQTQVPVRNAWDYIIATCDLGWEEWKVVVEYDGRDHWLNERQRTRDISRYEDLAELGWRVVRVNSKMLRDHQHTIIDRVRRQLCEAGCPS